MARFSKRCCEQQHRRTEITCYVFLDSKNRTEVLRRCDAIVLASEEVPECQKPCAKINANISSIVWPVSSGKALEVQYRSDGSLSHSVSKTT